MPMPLRAHTAPIAFLLFALAVIIAVVVLLALHDPVPSQMWAVEFGALSAAGVAVVPGRAADTSPGSARRVAPTSRKGSS